MEGIMGVMALSIYFLSGGILESRQVFTSRVVSIVQERGERKFLVSSSPPIYHNSPII